jgi:hypothetical protein
VGLLVELLLVGVVVVFDVSEIKVDGSEDVLGGVELSVDVGLSEN